MSRKRLTTEEFITRAREVHGDRYDYSLVEYVKSSVKVRIICPIHGVFEQSPNNHVSMKQGCPQCAVEQRYLNTREFIKYAREVHGDRYDYSLVEYKHNLSKVKIICPKHGVFEQRPCDHVSKKKGCSGCANNQRLTTEAFITRAREIHGDRYDYSLVEYVNARSNVQIVCPTHSMFEQTPHVHLKGSGCPQCGSEQKAEQKRLGAGEFITRAREVHGDSYDYSLVEYLNNRSKVRIICSEHSVFEQTPDTHLKGCACPQCSQAGFNPSEPGTLYVLADDKQCPTLLKVGITNNLKRRLHQLRRETPHHVVKLVSYPFPRGADAYKLEQEVHKVFHELNARLKGFDGATEWFEYSPVILDYINEKARN